MKDIKLNFGCGNKLRKGYSNVDLVEDRSGLKPDVNCDLRNLSVFEPDYADEILFVSKLLNIFGAGRLNMLSRSGFEF